MDPTTDIGQTRATAWRFDDVMQIAARLAGRDAVGTIHIAVPDRPTYHDILRYRRLAEESGLELTVTGDAVVLRPLPRDDGETSDHASDATHGDWRPALCSAAGRSWRRIHRAAAGWNAGFHGLSEGTR